MEGNTSISGSAAVGKDGDEYASTNGFFQLVATGTDASPTNHGDSVDFTFSFWQGKTQGPGDFVIACGAASWSTLAIGDPVALRNLCASSASLTLTLDEAGTVAVFDLSAIDGTVTVASSLDVHGDGSISLVLDVPHAQMTSIPGDASAPIVVDFSATKLTGVATYADRAAECPSSGDDGCGCRSSGVYHPGGD